MTLLLAAMAFLFTITTAFLDSSTISIRSNSCTLYVSTAAGSPVSSVKVSTEVCGGISCIGGRSFYTNSDGRVDLEWVDGCRLCKIYVDGRGYEVDYGDGGVYYHVME